MIGAVILLLIGLAILGGCVLCWSVAIAYWSHSGRLLPWTPRRHVPWNLLDVVLILLPIFLLLFGSIFFGAEPPKAPVRPPNVAQSRVLVTLDILIKAVLVLLATAYLVWKARARFRDFGLSLPRFGEHLLIGVVAYVMLMPPVLAVQALIVYFGKWKYEHPLIEMLEKTPDPLLFGLLAVSACIMAPLSEEWLFRGLLQGWLEKACTWIARRGEVMPPVAPQDLVVPPNVAVIDLEPSPTTGSAAEVNPYAPYAAPIDVPPPPAGDDNDAAEEPVPRSLLVHWLPILTSSLLFGLAHWGHGPAPIPLTLLAIGLGYVYQRTHSIVPVIVVHCLFNSFSMAIFYVAMFELKQPLP